MTIQTFRNAELDNVILEIGDQDEWKQLAAEMGLDKQMEFVQQAKSPLPYPYMNQSMQNIFGTLCGTKTDVKDYSKTPMPLEVMRELAFCKTEKYFNTIRIWYDDKTPDPIAVGTCTRFSASYYKTEEAKEKESDSPFEGAKKKKTPDASKRAKQIARGMARRAGDTGGQGGGGCTSRNGPWHPGGTGEEGGSGGGD